MFGWFKERRLKKLRREKARVYFYDKLIELSTFDRIGTLYRKFEEVNNDKEKLKVVLDMGVEGIDLLLDDESYFIVNHKNKLVLTKRPDTPTGEGETKEKEKEEIKSGYYHGSSGRLNNRLFDVVVDEITLVHKNGRIDYTDRDFEQMRENDGKKVIEAKEIVDIINKTDNFDTKQLRKLVKAEVDNLGYLWFKLTEDNFEGYIYILEVDDDCYENIGIELEEMSGCIKSKKITPFYIYPNKRYIKIGIGWKDSGLSKFKIDLYSKQVFDLNMYGMCSGI